MIYFIKDLTVLFQCYLTLNTKSDHVTHGPKPSLGSHPWL